MGDNGVLLEVRGLCCCYRCTAGEVEAARDVTLSVARGQTLGLVGESGCGKSTVAMSIMRLLGMCGGRVSGGEVVFDGIDLLGLSRRRMRAIRGGRIAMVFQEPAASMNPVLSVGEQVAEVVRAHEGVDRRRAWRRAIELLERVGIANAESRAGDYPHQFSGGMLQRMMIAAAISCGPELLIADEATTALDVTTQRAILDLIDDLKAERGMSVLLITHDIAVAGRRAERIAVMYGGRIVESGPAEQVTGEPLHPYSRALVGSIPRPGMKRLAVIEGQAGRCGSGCRFRDRCRQGRHRSRCSASEPTMRDLGGGRHVACHDVEDRQ